MSNIFEQYEKKNEFLVCVDSDGCAMDTMEIKHRKCFASRDDKDLEFKEKIIY